MEARAQEPASLAMFDALVRPLLIGEMRAVLDIGCGTASLARRIAAHLPNADVHASDKSAGMLKIAAHLAGAEGLARIRMAPWDVLEGSAFPFAETAYDLIVSSVMIVYLDEREAIDVVGRLAKRLKPGGVLAFIEQDLMTDAANDTTGLFLKVLEKDRRAIRPTQALGLARILKGAGLDVLPRASFLWTDDRYGAYTRELLERLADAAAARGAVTGGERASFKRVMDEHAAAGEFYYGLVYHRVAGRRGG